MKVELKSLTGNVSKIKVLRLSENPLIFFKLDEINCLISSHSLNFLADVENGMRVTVAGYYNGRKQFVVKRFAVIGKTKIMTEFENLDFPKRKVLF